MKVLTRVQAKSRERAELANRLRHSKAFKVGDRVLVRDPRHRKVGGRTAYKQPLSDPCIVKSVSGIKATLRRCESPDDETEFEAHFENMLLALEQARRLETREVLHFPEDDEYEVIEAVKKRHITKPVVAWCVGTCANAFNYDVQFGHAGAQARGDMEQEKFALRALPQRTWPGPKGRLGLFSWMFVDFWQLLAVLAGTGLPDRSSAGSGEPI